MIEINLSPKKPKKKEDRLDFKKIDFSSLTLEKAAVLKIGIAVVVALAALHSVLYVVGALSRSEMSLLDNKYNALLPKKAEADTLRVRKEGIHERVSAIDALMMKRFSWAKRLNALSDSMISGIWLSEFDYYEAPGERPASKSAAKSPAAKRRAQEAGAPPEIVITKYLIISGYASSMGEQGTALIGKFIKSLKENAGFYSDLSEIELKSIKTDRIGAQEVMNFRISCLFRD